MSQETTHYESYCWKTPLKSWKDIYTAYTFFARQRRQWIFRGHYRRDHHLQTSLERAISKFSPIYKVGASRKQLQKALKNGLGGSKVTRPKSALTIEGSLLRTFKRNCYNYSTELPNDNNTMDWLALMRHYGAPTRLLERFPGLFTTLCSRNTHLGVVQV